MFECRERGMVTSPFDAGVGAVELLVALLAGHCGEKVRLL